MHTSTRSSKMMYATLLVASTLYYSTVFAEGQSSPSTTTPSAVMARQPGLPALSPEQQEAFRTLSKEMYGNMREGRELHEEIRSLVQSDTYDEKQVRALIQKRHKEAEDSMVKSSQDMHNFYKSLTPEQKKQMDALHKKMQERMKEHRKDRREEQSAKEDSKQ